MNTGSSLDTRKENALLAISRLEDETPEWALAKVAGISRQTLVSWKKDDEQFAKDLEEILIEKRLSLVSEAQTGLRGCIKNGEYPAIRDTLRTHHRERWGETEQQTRPPSPVYLIGIYNETKILMQQTNGKNGKPKEIEGDK